MKKIRVADMVLCAMFAALSAALSQLAIPIGPVPINLTHLSVFLAGGLLGAGYGAVSQLVFVLLGAMGAPVFSEFSGGLGVIMRETGGFILGYIACAFLTGLAADRLGRSPKVMIPAMAVGMLATYLPGILWFMVVTGNPLGASLGYCVWPFLPGDAAKIAVCATLLPVLDRTLHRAGLRRA